ncbi:hypothetical protein JFK97_18870 [Chromobacterium phragmitis]|uniref:hypothetical protein n=1 Tax=Chromobacterium amazonense TaxID=1382803 RepID=UPI0021B81ED9|nr:hypothetical protein [Chromobacterium amazonense]MBM2886455.1 hypothetical protein [Chromobacterium amazonense]
MMDFKITAFFAFVSGLIYYGATGLSGALALVIVQVLWVSYEVYSLSVMDAAHHR